MKATCVLPIATIRGLIGKEYYARVVRGKVVVQRRPHYKKAPTEAQQKARKQFAERYVKHKEQNEC